MILNTKNLLLAALCAWGGSGAFAQNELPSGLKIQGELQDFKTWTDKAGRHYLVFTNDLSGGSLTWYGTAYLEKSGAYTQEWQIRDFPKVKNGGVWLFPETFQHLDLDGDGLDETAFMYTAVNQPLEAHDGAALADVKLMVHSAGKKYAVRALDIVEMVPADKASFDPAFDKAPQSFRNLARLIWSEQTSFEEMENLLTPLANIDGYWLFRKTYQFASGGDSYVLFDKNLDPLEVSGLEFSLEQQPVKGALVYLCAKKGLCRYAPATKKSEVLYPISDELVSRWAKVGNRVAFCTADAVHVLDVDASFKVLNKQTIKASIFSMAASETVLQAPRLSADGKTVFYEVMDEASGGALEKSAKLK